MIRREGIKKILIFIFLGIIFAPVSLPFSLLFLSFATFLTYFYRDPDRKIGNGVVSPADGKIVEVSEKRVEIFMGPFDCHVNRSPVSGVVRSIKLYKGRKIPAFISGKNVYRNEILIKNELGEFKVVQVAGFFARRISCFVKEGQKVEKGEKIGLIHFGSKVILEVPEYVKFVVKKGDKIKAGDKIAYIQNS